MILPALSFEVVAIVVAVFLLALLPTRRLFLAGWSSRSLATYLLLLIFLGLTLVALRFEGRFLLPIVVVVYLAPFVTAPIIERLRRNQGPGGRLPPRDVTPRDVTPRQPRG